MEAKKINQEEITVLDVESAIINEERSLILLENRPPKKIDETISTPHQYVSRYHYETKDLGSFLELCPHCRKPSITSLRRTVVDTAIKYLNEKEDRREHRANLKRVAISIASLIGIAGAVYYLFFHLMSGFRL
ncbi:MAG: hypothetical protein V3V39_05060 [Desulfobacterales bacterium]|jgi:hypothetical protein